MLTDLQLHSSQQLNSTMIKPGKFQHFFIYKNRLISMVFKEWEIYPVEKLALTL